MTDDRHEMPHPLLARATWLTGAQTQRVLVALTAEGHGARAVGGAVRNTLLELPVADVDIATDARPEQVMVLAARAGMKTIPTGIAHGTVTVIAGGQPYEVTTLRRDVETHGRHATVAFTDDWRADAERRDFTMNALYCDARGVLFDPVGGLVDLERRRVRFIGDAHARIAEDYLRILRFFRFSAEYGEGIVDAVGLEACIAEQEGLSQLSAERVRAELLRLLVARHVRKVIDVLSATGLLALLLGGTTDVRAFHRLHDIGRVLAADETVLSSKAIDHDPAPQLSSAYAHLERSECVDALLGLAALAVSAPEDGERLKQRLRLSREEASRLVGLASAARAWGRVTGGRGAEPDVLVYRHGRTLAADALKLAWARSSEAVTYPGWRAAARSVARAAERKLPFSGADVVALGVAPGPRVGDVLRAFEAWWIEAGFPEDELGNHAMLAQLAQSGNMVSKA